MVPPHSRLILLYYILDGGVEGMVLCVWYCVAPSLPLDTAVFYGVDGGVDWYCGAPSIPLDTAVFSRADGGVEGMVLRGLVPLCHLPSS